MFRKLPQGTSLHSNSRAKFGEAPGHLGGSFGEASSFCEISRIYVKGTLGINLRGKKKSLFSSKCTMALSTITFYSFILCSAVVYQWKYYEVSEKHVGEILNVAQKMYLSYTGRKGLFVLFRIQNSAIFFVLF